MPVPTQTSTNAWVEEMKARSAYRNTDLPPACQDARWPKTFLPTIYLWAGSQPNLWNISDDGLLEAINTVFEVVYPDVEYIPTLQGSVFGIVCSFCTFSLYFESHELDFRLINVSRSGGAILAPPPLPSSLILWRIMMMLMLKTSQGPFS